MEFQLFFIVKILVQGEKVRKKVKICVLYIHFLWKDAIIDNVKKISLKRKVIINFFVSKFHAYNKKY